MAASIKITYTDGTSTVARMTPKALVIAERHFGKDMPPVESSLYVAWVQAAPGVSFDDWLDTVEDASEEQANPPVAAPSPVSPASPSPQD